MKVLTIAFLTTIAGFFFSSGTLSADDGFSTNASATVTSMYLFRGYDMSMEDPALQGDYIVSHDSGFWIGAWGSMYDFGIEDGVEIDFIGGFDYAISDEVSIGVGFTEYTYTGDTGSNTEFYLSLSYNNFSLAYYEDTDLDTTYISLDAEFEVAEDLSLMVHAADYETSNDLSAGLNYSFDKHISIYGNYTYVDRDNVGDDNYLIIGVTYSF